MVNKRGVLSTRCSNSSFWTDASIYIKPVLIMLNTCLYTSCLTFHLLCILTFQVFSLMLVVYHFETCFWVQDLEFSCNFFSLFSTIYSWHVRPKTTCVLCASCCLPFYPLSRERRGKVFLAEWKAPFSFPFGLSKANNMNMSIITS